MRVISFLFLFFISISSLQAQPAYSDSLKKALRSATVDSQKVSVLAQLSTYYSMLYLDSGRYYADEIISLSVKQEYSYGEALGMLLKSHAESLIGNYPDALRLIYSSMEIANTGNPHRLELLGLAYEMLSELNALNGNTPEAISFLHKSWEFYIQDGGHETELAQGNFSMAYHFANLGDYDSAIYYMKKGKPFLPLFRNKSRITFPWLVMGNIYNDYNEFETAEKYYREGIHISEQYNAQFPMAGMIAELGGLYRQTNRWDSGVYLMKKALSLAIRNHYLVFAMVTSNALSRNVYDTINADSALKYLKMSLEFRDSLNSDTKQKQFQQVIFDNEKRHRELETEKNKFNAQLKLYAVAIVLLVFLILAFIFRRNYKQKYRANLLLQEEKEKVELTLRDLKSTQTQLIQSEKMASLGKLTAGIAHEIQNPLNFVNNFSDLNGELISDLKNEIISGNMDEVNSIAETIADNEKKINLHGKRADAIVKGMLLHSRSNLGTRELTDINALTDEYLRLAYHGLRSRDKTFNASLITDYEKDIPALKIISQDIGRVILNIITNSFYALEEKKNHQGDSFEPSVTVSTHKTNKSVEIWIKDTGTGIPQQVLDKVFEPFFTTKPTGQGTGLGLSLSYDIIKAHQGELKVTTEEGKGTTFIIELPIQ